MNHKLSRRIRPCGNLRRSPRPLIGKNHQWNRPYLFLFARVAAINSNASRVEPPSRPLIGVQIGPTMLKIAPTSSKPCDKKKTIPSLHELFEPGGDRSTEPGYGIVQILRRTIRNTAPKSSSHSQVEGRRRTMLRRGSSRRVAAICSPGGTSAHEAQVQGHGRQTQTGSRRTFRFSADFYYLGQQRWLESPLSPITNSTS